jgi:hypothetical protein
MISIILKSIVAWFAISIFIGAPLWMWIMRHNRAYDRANAEWIVTHPGMVSDDRGTV